MIVIRFTPQGSILRRRKILTWNHTQLSWTLEEWTEQGKKDLTDINSKRVAVSRFYPKELSPGVESTQLLSRMSLSGYQHPSMWFGRPSVAFIGLFQAPYEQLPRPRKESLIVALGQTTWEPDE